MKHHFKNGWVVTFEPGWRTAWAVLLVTLAAYHYGFGAALLVLLAPLEVKFR